MLGPERKKAARLAMKIACGVSFFLFCLYMVVYLKRNFAWAKSVALWSGMLSYQMMIRLATPVWQNSFFVKQHDPDSPRFRQKAWEPEWFRILRVHTWVNAEAEESAYEGVWSPAEKINDTCHAESIHRLTILTNAVVVVISFLMGTAKYFGVSAAIFSLYDGVQIIRQRYRRLQLQANTDYPYTKPL